MATIGFPSSRYRNTLCDSAIASTSSALENPRIEDGLDEAIVHNLRIINDRVVVPNMRNGRIEMPREYDDDEHIPVVALWPGEKLLHTLRPSELQINMARLAMAQSFEHNNSLELAESQAISILEDLHKQELLVTTRGILNGGVTLSLAETAIVDKEAIIWRSMPAIVINLLGLSSNLDEVYQHELAHAMDSVTYPIRCERSAEHLRLRTELLAYGVQYQMNQVSGNGSTFLEESVMVERIRERFNGTIPGNTKAFEPRDEIRSALRRRMLGYIFS